MTTYNGTNMGLEQNADGTWVFTNPAQTFIDPATFSTPDPAFQYAPTDDTTTEEDITCEEGYVYDHTLKKCVLIPTTYEGQVAAYMGGTEQETIPGTGRLLETNITPNIEGGTNVFPYTTTGKTRAQMNEHMLLMEGVTNGWLVDNGKGQFIQQPFKKGGEGIEGFWAGNAMNYFNQKSYDDYFKILNEGWQPKGDNLWNEFLRGNNVYSLTGKMKYGLTTTGKGGTGGRTVSYYSYSPDFQVKIDQALKLRQQGTDAIIDRDGEININADGKGGYYNENGKFVNEYGQVSATGSLSSGIKYLFELQKSGLKMPTSLRNRLIKGLQTAALSPGEKNKLAIDAGFNNLNDAVNAMNNIDSWSMADVTTDVTTDVTDGGTTVGTDVTTVDDSGITTLDLGGTEGTGIIETIPGGGEFGGVPLDSSPSDPPGGGIPDNWYEPPEPSGSDSSPSDPPGGGAPDDWWWGI